MVTLRHLHVTQSHFSFSYSRYKLMARDMGPATRCVNDDAPPPQVII